MKIKLCVNCARFHVPGGKIEEEIELPDGLTDDEIESEVQDDLKQMVADYAEAWWEKVDDEND